MANKGTSGNKSDRSSSASSAKDRNITGNFNKGSQKAKNKSYDGNPVGGPNGKKSSVMRESTWNNMSAGQQRNGYGTTSYAKYKAGNTTSSGGGSRSDR